MGRYLKIMRTIDHMPSSVCARIDTLFSDIDDTITTHGRVPKEAFGAIWDAHDAGLNLVLVTGRPAGWCDHFARMWPVSAVVGENGALCFASVDGRIQRLWSPRPEGAQARLDLIEKEVLATIPRAAIASDQAYRAYDLAVDFAEEVQPPLNEAAIDGIVDVFERHGATAKISSIHVNGWYGDFDKLSMCHRYSRELLGAPLDLDRATFLGDSPNDVPMFARFPHACGVANVQAFRHRMESLPAYVASAEGGAGFAEIVGHILKNR